MPENLEWAVPPLAHEKTLDTLGISRTYAKARICTLQFLPTEKLAENTLSERDQNIVNQKEKN